MIWIAVSQGPLTQQENCRDRPNSLDEGGHQVADCGLADHDPEPSEGRHGQQNPLLIPLVSPQPQQVYEQDEHVQTVPRILQNPSSP